LREKGIDFREKRKRDVKTRKKEKRKKERTSN